MASWISHDVIEIPATAQGDDGLIGDGLIKIGPDDSRWRVWANWLLSQGQERPSAIIHEE